MQYFILGQEKKKALKSQQVQVSPVTLLTKDCRDLSEVKYIYGEWHVYSTSFNVVY